MKNPSLKLALTFSLLFFTNIALGQQPTDCINAVTICGNSNVNLDVNGIGTQELNASNNCSSQENNSIWLKVTVIGDGTLAFILTPGSSDINEDYDFFIFGPNVNCDNIGQAVRCSTTNPALANQGDNLTGLNTTETENAEGPGADGNSFVSAIDALAGETYFIVIDRPVGNSPFNLVWTGTAQFSSPPINALGDDSLLNINNCDTTAPYNDGITGFNLDNNTLGIIGFQNNVTVSYHLSESDANLSTNILTSPFSNTSNPQQIYARITNTVTDCFIVSPFELNVTPGPNIVTPTSFIVCDDDIDGDETNGFTNFNLTIKNSEILNGLDSSNFIITYHSSINDAETNTALLNNNYTNTIAFAETIYVRVESLIDVGCANITSLDLVVNPIPEGFDSTLFQCDEDGISDGFTIFNLTQANDELTGNNTNLVIKFFSSLNDAQNTSNEIDGNLYNNITNPQTIYVQIIDETTSCFDIKELILQVSATQIYNYIAAPVCDELDSEDGLNTFNLNDFSTDILNGLPADIELNYYESYNDALLEQNALTSPYNNTIPYSQTLYVRAENDNACYGISEVSLSINPLPQIEDDETILYCLNNFPEPLILEGGIINGIPNNYYYNWSTGESSIEIEINEVGTYSVTVTNTSGCSKTRTITVEPSNIATIENIEIIDGSLQNNTVTVLTTGEGEYQYALINQDGETTAFQESNVFTNIFPGIYSVLVRDFKNDCGIADMGLSVIGFPLFFTPNGDNINDTWQVYGVSSKFQSHSIIHIFDRYGKLITQLKASSKGWDGTLEGIPLPATDYWFAVTLDDGRVYKNHFSLKR